MDDGQDPTPKRRWEEPFLSTALVLILCLGPGGSPALPSAHAPGPHAYRGKLIGQVREHSFRGQKSWVFPQLVEITQKDEFILLAPSPGIFQGFIDYPACHVASF